VTAGDPGPRGDGSAPDGSSAAATSEADERRPLVERIGLAAIAAVIVILFVFVAVASWVSGEPFLAFMGALGVVMTGWMGLRTLLRG
jgi:hypothetical protein